MWISRYTPKRGIIPVATSRYWMLLMLMILPAVSATGGLLREAQKRRRAHSDNQTFFEHENQPQQEEEEQSSLNQTVTSVFGWLFGFAIVSAVCCLLRTNQHRIAQETNSEEAKAEEQEKEQLRQRNFIKAIFRYRGLQMKLDSHHFFHHEDDPRQSRNTASSSYSFESERKHELEPDQDDLPASMDYTESCNGDHPPESEEEDDDLEMGCSQRLPKTDGSVEIKAGTESGNTLCTTNTANQEDEDVSMMEPDPTRQKDEDGNNSDSMEQEQGHACLLNVSAPNADYNDDEDDKIVLKIAQRNGEPSSSERSLPNMCAICLDGYQTGHTIVWSSNKACAHAFHQSCIVDYLMSQQQKQEQQTESRDTTTWTPLKLVAPCPMCRQTFLPPQHQPKKNKKNKK